jgi:hypothetical protein
MKNLQSVLGLALAGLALIFSVGFLAYKPAPKSAPTFIPSAPSTYTEVMPESSGESFRTHVRGADGIETEVRVRYLDGSNAILLLHESGKVLVERRFFTDGTVRKEARFTESGLLTSGFELRIDRSMLWKTVRSDQFKVVTQSYWPDGTLFQECVVELDSKTSSRAFYRADGMRWQEDLSNGAGVLTERRLYDESGRLRVLYSIVKDGVSDGFIQVLYLDENGDPDFDQRWGYASDYYHDPGGGRANTNRVVIKSIGQYVDGRLTTRVHRMSSGRIHQVEHFKTDGSIERWYVQFQGWVSQIETETSGGGRTSQFDFDGKFGKAPPVDSRFLLPLPDGDVPIRLFEQSEKELPDGQ